MNGGVIDKIAGIVLTPVDALAKYLIPGEFVRGVPQTEDALNSWYGWKMSSPALNSQDKEMIRKAYLDGMVKLYPGQFGYEEGAAGGNYLENNNKVIRLEGSYTKFPPSTQANIRQAWPEMNYTKSPDSPGFMKDPLEGSLIPNSTYELIKEWQNKK